MTLGRPRTVTDEAILTALAGRSHAWLTLEPHAGVEGQASDRYRVAADEGGALKLGRDERFDVPAADAGYRGGHALTGEERGVVGVGADSPGDRPFARIPAR
jgi:hypothetical protein